MNLIPPVIERLVMEFAKLPGVGPKTAQRLAFYCMRMSPEWLEGFAGALMAVRDQVHPCQRCFFIAQGELCAICSDSGRNATQLCVVEEPMDVLAIERSGEFRGQYHVLEGAISPIDGIGPDQLRVSELEGRLEGVTEVIIATDPDVEGEATAHYLADRLSSKGLSVTRLAHGLPAGADLEYADELTVARALTGRTSL